MRLRAPWWAWAGGALGAALLVLGSAAYVWRTELLRSWLDPGVPFQIYKPPPPPDYARRAAWALLPAKPETWTAGDPAADVFFVHPTTYDGGRDWNAPIGEGASDARLFQVMLPNYAGPFQRVGRLFAPRYRQAGLYSFTTLRDDARDARRFAYGDVEAAFRQYLQRWNGRRPLVLVGVEQGGGLVARLATEALAADPGLKARLAAVYLIDTVVPAEGHSPGDPLPACRSRSQARCVVAWAQAPTGGASAARTLLERAQVWTPTGLLDNLGGRPALCVNPLTGGEGGVAGERANLGAANATGLEWGARPGFLPRQVGADCRGGLLWLTRPHSPALKSPHGWIAQMRAAPFNLFYADLEADARARVAVMTGHDPDALLAPPITQSITVQPSPVHRIR